MLAEERRQYIQAILQKDGRVVVSELAHMLGISRITARKDLDYLEEKGVVERTHGGALATLGGSLTDLSHQQKERHRFREKQQIARAAAKLVREGQCILLDSGTTTMAIARTLRHMHNITVVTNAVNIAAELANTRFEVLLTGGMLRKNSFSLIGPQAEEMLSEIHADILFLGVDGFDPQLGVTTPNLLESRVNRAMVHAARKVVAVCDSTKFTRRSLALIAPPSAIHTVITDSNILQADADALREAGIELIIA